MLVHKCDACGKIFEGAAKRRKYEINIINGPGSIRPINEKILVDICDECYSAVASFLEKGASDET